MRAAIVVFVLAAVFFGAVLLGVVRVGPSSPPPAPIEVRLGSRAAVQTGPGHADGALKVTYVRPGAPT